MLLSVPAVLLPTKVAYTFAMVINSAADINEHVEGRDAHD